MAGDVAAPGPEIDPAHTWQRLDPGPSEEGWTEIVALAYAEALTGGDVRPHPGEGDTLDGGPDMLAVAEEAKLIVPERLA